MNAAYWIVVMCLALPSACVVQEHVILDEETESEADPQTDGDDDGETAEVNDTSGGPDTDGAEPCSSDACPTDTDDELDTGTGTGTDTDDDEPDTDDKPDTDTDE